MDSNKNNSVTLTEKRIASAKGLHLICAILAMILNIIAFAVLAVNVRISEITYLMFPLALAVLDIIFFIKVIFSNYRFKYAITGAVIHAVAVLLISAVAYVVLGIIEANKGIVFVTFSIYAMLAVHVLQSVATLVTALCATKGGKSFRKILGVILTVAFACGAAIYGRTLVMDGFFGQGGYTEYRTVVYKYDAATDSYMAIDVLDGYGTSVVIPTSFNGGDVNSIDCSLFAHDELTSVRVDCGHKVKLVDIDHLTHVNPDLEIYAPHLYMDDFRRTLYSLVSENQYALNLANHIYPSDIKENEVYISFGYESKEILELVEYNIIPTWVQEKGTAFDIKAHAANLSFIEKSNALNTDDLYWCFQNQSQKIFKCIQDAEGNSLQGSVINESVVNAKVVFENLYRLEIMADNEAPDKTPIKDNIHRYIETVDGVYKYKIATLENIKSHLEKLPSRSGFALKIKTGANKHELTSIEDEIELISQAGGNTLTVYPEWQLLDATIDSLTAGGQSNGYTAVYGQNVVLASSATPPDASISIKYEWLYNGNVIATGNTHTLNNIYPNDNDFASFTRAGVYTLRVTAGEDATTKLKSVVEKEIEIGFEKKELGFEWILPSDLVYSATDKAISVNYRDESQIINSDNVTYKLSQTSVRNAGNYTIRLELTDKAAKLYAIPTVDASKNISVTPYPIEVVWDTVLSFVYDGQNHKPTAEINGLLEDGVIALDVFVIEGGIKVDKKNYGTYTATASTTNGNYSLEGTQKEFSITQRPISVSAWGKNTFVYTSYEQRPGVTELDNIIDTDPVLAEIIYVGQETNVGSYTVEATLSPNSNYKFESPQTYEYTITPKALTIKITDAETTYNGKVYENFTFTSEGVANKDTISEILSLNYKGAAATAINVNSQGYEIDADIIAASKYDNYSVTIEKGTLTIKKRTMVVNIDNVTKVYNGLPFETTDATFAFVGLADTDEISEVLALNYKGTAIGAVNYSAIGYKIEASVVEGAKYGNYDVTVNTATLRVTKAPLIITAVGGTKEYDGAVGKGFTFIADGLVNNEQPDALGTPSYSGAATNRSYAGTHELKVTLPANAVTNNYAITYESGEYVITKKPLTVTVVSGSKVYNGYVSNSNEFDYEVSGLISTETKSNLGTPTYGGAATVNKNVGDYVLSVTLPENSYTRNYDINYIDGTYRITQRDITVKIIDGKMTYNGKTPIFTSGNFTIENLAATDSKTDFRTEFGGSAATAVNADTYTLTVTLSGSLTDNYNITYVSGIYEIAPKPLTITAVAQSRDYDGSKGGEFSVRQNGLLSTESLSMLGRLSYGGAAVNAINAGAYDLSVMLVDMTSAANNYDITYIDGTLNVNRVKVIITAFAVESRMYDGVTKGGNFSAKADGLVNGEELSDLGSLSYSGTATSAKTVGTYNLTVSIPNATSVADNYDITYVPGTFVITKAPIVITAVANNKIYDGNKGEFSVDVEGLKGTDTVSGLGAFTYGGTAANAIDVGVYNLTVTLNITNNNYYVDRYVDSSFEISKKNISVTVNASNRVYDGTENNIFTVSSADIVKGQNLASLGTITPVYNGDRSVVAKDAGYYTITVEITGLKNYNVVNCNSSAFTIEKKEVTVTAIGGNKIYDGNAASEFNFEVSGLADAADLQTLGKPTYSGTATNATEVGEYDLSVTLPEHKNYTFKYVSGKLVITAPAPTPENTGGTTATPEVPVS